MVLKNKNKNIGFGMVEAVVVISIIAVFVLLSLSVNAFYAEISKRNKHYIQASFLAEEGVEALKYMRDDSWTTNIDPLIPNTDYYLIFNSGWVSTTVAQNTNEYYRSFRVYDVLRDVSGDIVETGGTLDPGTKFLQMKVEWLGKNGTTTREVSAYITDIFGN
jgi:Tfp pilus assembly protein PilE